MKIYFKSIIFVSIVSIVVLSMPAFATTTNHYHTSKDCNEPPQWVTTKPSDESIAVVGHATVTKDNDLTRVTLESSSCSGDWLMIDEYVYDANLNITELKRTYSTFSSSHENGIRQITTTKYDTKHNITATKSTLLDMKTNEEIKDASAVSFMTPEVSTYLTFGNLPFVK